MSVVGVVAMVVAIIGMVAVLVTRYAIWDLILTGRTEVRRVQVR